MDMIDATFRLQQWIVEYKTQIYYFLPPMKRFEKCPKKIAYYYRIIASTAFSKEFEPTWYKNQQNTLMSHHEDKVVTQKIIDCLEAGFLCDIIQKL